MELHRRRRRRRCLCSLNALVKRAGQVLSPCNIVVDAAAAADHFPTDLSAADKLQIVQLWSELQEGGPRRDDGATAEAGPGNFCFEEFRRPD